MPPKCPKDAPIVEVVAKVQGKITLDSFT